MHYNSSVSNTSVKVVPMPNPKGAPAFVAGATYAVGQYVKSKRRVYMCLTAGTAGSTAPVGAGDVSDGTLTWRSCLPRPRNGLTIVNEGSIAAYVTLGSPAVANKGVVLTTNGALTFSNGGVPQCEISVIRAAATAGNISVLEW